MAEEEDPEKRFHSIMDKLFQQYPNSPSSPPSTSSSGVTSSRGKKRLSTESALALVEPKSRGDSLGGGEAPPLCRPWDRGDLMRRVATFKSMTWFAKPKVVSAVNCARRGWINVDQDIITCEACGARLLFSTPSTWTQQQVEKAALVFSLKLDIGHKLLCPWTDNACDERLAEFPPTPIPVLADKFRERSSTLLQLSALPIVSSSAINYMKMTSTQLEEFLKQSPVLELGNESANMPQIETVEIESESGSAELYNQAHKLISLCGWEPRSLPYVVECKDMAKHLVENADILNSSPMIANGQNPSISFHSTTTTSEAVEVNEHSLVVSEMQTDPNSVVLDCRLCGASVGLWTFHTVPRPVELFRLVGYTEVNSKKNSGQDVGSGNLVDDRGGIVNSTPDGALFSKDRQSNLNLTIAGGPPPTKQNFKAKISLPVIGRDLRARLSYDSHFRDSTYNNQEDAQYRSEKNIQFLENQGVSGGDYCEQASQPETTGLLMSKTPDLGQCSYANRSLSSSLSLENSENIAAFLKEKSTQMSLEETDVTGRATFPETCNIECATQSTTSVVQGFDQCDGLLRNLEDIGSLESAIACEIESRKDGSSNILNKLDAQVNSQEGRKDGVQIPVNTELVAYDIGKDAKQLSVDKATEFDPIRQHRHFCPWIVSTGSSGAPGWQQTLSALQRQREHSHSPSNSPSSISMVKVDDPITSVRRLFMSPTAKRMKTTTGSGGGTGRS